MSEEELPRLRRVQGALAFEQRVRSEVLCEAFGERLATLRRFELMTR